jgi:hypothetical protein
MGVMVRGWVRGRAEQKERFSHSASTADDPAAAPHGPRPIPHNQSAIRTRPPYARKRMSVREGQKEVKTCRVMPEGLQLAKGFEHARTHPREPPTTHILGVHVASRRQQRRHCLRRVICSSPEQGGISVLRHVYRPVRSEPRR